MPAACACRFRPSTSTTRGRRAGSRCRGQTPWLPCPDRRASRVSSRHVSDSLVGRVALITGAGRGQGRSHAVALARAGADVVACDLAADLSTVPYGLSTPDELDRTADAVRQVGRRCLVAVADVRDPAAMEDLVARGTAEIGRIDIVCANAGVISFGRSW